MVELDSGERKILAAFETGKLKSVANVDTEQKKHRLYAVATSKKDKRISNRISSRDLTALRKRALIEGLPYLNIGNNQAKQAG